MRVGRDREGPTAVARRVGARQDGALPGDGHDLSDDGRNRDLVDGDRRRSADDLDEQNEADEDGQPTDDGELPADEPLTTKSQAKHAGLPP